MLGGFHAYMAYSTANRGPRMFESSVLKMRKLETDTEVVSDYIIYMGTTCCLWIDMCFQKLNRRNENKPNENIFTVDM